MTIGTTATTGDPTEEPAPRIAILSRAGDFHAFAIRHALIERDVACSIVETDGLAGRARMSWSPGGEVEKATMDDVDGNQVEIEDLDLIWWRRLTGEPRLPDSLRDETARDLVARDCRTTLFGIVLTRFTGRWISHPEATRLAENKLIQLEAATSEGLGVPRTLVSQDPFAVRRFCRELDHRVVVKTVAGTPKTPIMTGRVTEEMLRSDEAISVSPAIYQELIPGRRHLRICCFGERTYGAVLETDRLDWRYPLDATAAPYDVDESIVAALQRVLDRLGLRMGIFDMKLDPDGKPWWLEVNPQGQFLFLEGMCGLPLTEAFTDFLLDEVRSAPRRQGARRPELHSQRGSEAAAH